MTPAAWLVITTLETPEQARSLAEEAVRLRHAACVHITAAGESVYRWDDQIEQASEVTLLIKTSAERYAALEAWLQERHPYTTPEIIALPISAGLPAYLDWIEQCTR